MRMAASAATRRGPAAPPTADIARAQNGSPAFQLHPSGRNVRPHVFRWKPSASALCVRPARHTQCNLHTYVEYVCGSRSPSAARAHRPARIHLHRRADQSSHRWRPPNWYFTQVIIEPLLSTPDGQRSRIEPQNASEVGCPARRRHMDARARSRWLRARVRQSGGRAGRLPAPVARRPSDHLRRAPSFHFALSPESARASRTAHVPSLRTPPDGCRLQPASYTPSGHDSLPQLLAALASTRLLYAKEDQT